MGGTIFLIQPDGQLMELNEQEYDSEDLLQSLLARYPNLLPGDQINSEVPRRWLFIAREAPIPSAENGAGRWAVDHLFLDQDAVPTLVEVKRSTDTRIRREVIGQMLDYAANAVVYWPLERIMAQFEANCHAQGTDPEQVIRDFLDAESDPQEYWQQVKTNLQAGRVRLLFVADQIPPELQRVVEFLNTQMDPAEVLALEIKQFVGRGLKTMVPKIIGLTARKPGISSPVKQWDETSFFQDLQSRRPPAEVQTARQILAWAQAHGLRLWWGRGKKYGSFFPICEFGNEGYLLFSVWTYGTIEVQFQELKKKAPFASEASRMALLHRLNELPNISLPTDAITRRPSITLSSLTDPSVLQRFLDIFIWVMDEIRGQDKNNNQGSPG